MNEHVNQPFQDIINSFYVEKLRELGYSDRVIERYKIMKDINELEREVNQHGSTDGKE